MNTIDNFFLYNISFKKVKLIEALIKKNKRTTDAMKLYT